MASTEAALKRWFGMFTSGDLLKVDLIIDITGMKGLSLCWLKMKSKICLSIYTYSPLYLLSLPKCSQLYTGGKIKGVWCSFLHLQ